MEVLVQKLIILVRSKSFHRPCDTFVEIGRYTYVYMYIHTTYIYIYISDDFYLHAHVPFASPPCAPVIEYGMGPSWPGADVAAMWGRGHVG
jgi:hypothetical protein